MKMSFAYAKTRQPPKIPDPTTYGKFRSYSEIPAGITRFGDSSINIRFERETSMLDNNTYNLMEDITVLSKSLYRYDTYIQDAKDCKSCQDFWKQMRQQREKELSMFLQELQKHASEGKLNP
jgi:hypothetical protein